MNEIWKDIPWYEGKYQASNMWNVRSLKYRNTNDIKCLSPQKNKKWYMCVRIPSNWLYRTRRVHHLVMITFVWEFKAWMNVNHKNWVKTDNRLLNLEYCTPSQNTIHSYYVLWNINKVKRWSDNLYSRSVRQYTMDMKFIQEFWSVSEACDAVWDTWNHVWQACKWTRSSAKWFKWEYV